MNNLYNKILNEVYLIQGFDSWDNTENTFKDNIEKSLRGKYFIYKSDEMPIRIFDKGAYWLQGPLYKDKVYYNGKNIKLNYSAMWDARGYKYSNPNKEYYIVIKNLDGIKDCDSMFYNCDRLISIPEFDTSQCKTMRCMFENCILLENVPRLNTKSITMCYGMFGIGQSYQGWNTKGHLNEETLRIWDPDDNGTPQKNLPKGFSHWNY